MDDAGADVLTTLYIDANMKIRGVEVKKIVAGDIMSTNDSRTIVDKLMEEIGRMQDQIITLEKRNKELEEKYRLLLEKSGNKS